MGSMSLGNNPIIKNMGDLKKKNNFSWKFWFWTVLQKMCLSAPGSFIMVTFFGLYSAKNTKGYSHEVKPVFDDFGEDKVFLKKLKYLLCHPYRNYNLSRDSMYTHINVIYIHINVHIERM